MFGDFLTGYRQGWRGTFADPFGAAIGGFQGGQGVTGRLSGFFGGLGSVRTTFPTAWGEAPGWAGRVGFGLGAATPLLAGGAMFSGLYNVTRGRYGRAAISLALGAGLVGAMYYGAMRPTAAPIDDTQ